MEMTKLQKQALTATNKLLAALESGKIHPTMSVNERAKFLKVSPTQYYPLIKRLKVMGRISKQTYRKNSPVEILDNTPVTPEEYIGLGDPYKGNKRASYLRRKAAKRPKPQKTSDSAFMPQGEGTVRTLLEEPLDVPINHEPEHITLSGPVDAMIRFMQALKGTS